MKKLLSTLAVLSFSVALASAGSWGKSTIERTPAPPAGCDAFGTGFEFAGFAAGVIPEHSGDAFGGGIALSYFFTEEVGVDLSYTVGAFDSEEHIFSANLVYRIPVRELCIAPYGLLGGGFQTNGSTDGFFDLGVGLDIRPDFLGGAGIFVDATYNWVSSEEDFTLIRGGVRIPF